VADACPGALDGSFGCFSQQMFELGEDLFDRVEIGAIGRQEEQPCACSPDRARTSRLLWLPTRLLSAAATGDVRAGTVRNFVCGAIVEPQEADYGDQEGHTGPTTLGA
jgi:hypothetical protein